MLRSITLNLQGMDDEGTQNLELVASMEKDFNKLGITLYDTDGQMKSTFDILSALAEVYPSLDQNTKNYYASLIGGKNQVDVVNSILTNFTTAINANKAAMDSSGSAMKENETYVNSLQGHLSQLNSAWQELAKNTINSDLVKWLLDVGTGIVKITNNVGGLVPILTTISGLIIMFKADKIVSGFSKIGNSVKSVYNGFKILKQYLLGAKNAEIIYMDATAGATIATNLLTLSVGSLVAAFSIAVQIYNAIKQARKEATEALISEVKETQNEAKNKKEQIEQAETSLKTLKEQKDAYLKMAEAQGIATDNNKYLQSKQNEIDKTQENIDKLKEERKEKMRSAVVNAGSIPTGEVKGSLSQSFEKSGMAPGKLGWLNLFEDIAEDSKVSDMLDDINSRLESSKNNIGAYYLALQDEKTKIEEVIAAKKGNNESTKDEYEVLSFIT